MMNTPEELGPNAINYQPEEKPPDLRPIAEMLEYLAKRKMAGTRDIIGLPTKRWSVFNQSFGGARGELVAVTSETGEGKTTFTRNWIFDVVDGCGETACLFTLEDPIQSTSEVLAQMAVGEDIQYMTDAELTKAGKKFDEWKLWYLNHRGMLPEQHLYNAIYYAVQQLGCRFFVVDHLDYIEKSWGHRNESYVIGDCVRRLAGIAHKENVTIVLVVHPAKLQTRGVRSREVGADELKGSSSIKQEADAVFTLYRPDRQKSDVYLRFLKIRNHRFGKNMMGRIKFALDPTNLLLNEVSSELEFNEE